MEAKKISFGFSKLTKKSVLIPAKNIEKERPAVELIKCLEGQEIRVFNETPEETPLVIPLKDGQKTSTALASLKKRRAVLLGEEEETEAEAVPPKLSESVTETNGAVEEDLEKRAARELLAELQEKQEITETNFVLPVVKPDDLPLDGAKEATLDDYEQVPVEQFGKAMLRGMGWVDPPPPKKGEKLLDDAPYVRPKGMGLGADKALKLKPLLVQPDANEVLEIKKLAYVRILGGKHKDLYGQIEGFNEHAGRVIVKMAIGGGKEEFNEFLCQPVAKKEFTQYGKYLNSAKYEEYKKSDNSSGQQSKQEKSIDQKYEIKNDRNRGRDRHDADKKYRPKEETHERNRDRERGSSRGKDNKRNPRSRERSTKDYLKQKDSASTSHRRRTDEATTSDTSNSSDSESDADSAYERKHKMKSAKKSKSHKSTKRSKSKTRHQRRHSSTDAESSSSEEEQRRKKSKKHKKKTKKSKRQRSRSRSRDRHRTSKR